MLRFWKSSEPPGRRVGILPAAFNPVTVAHLEMARAARQQYGLDEVLFLLPLLFPHKQYTGASLEQRIEMLREALAAEPRFSIGSTDRGLFLEIARECRPVYGPEAELFFLCGRDAAERIAGWDYSGEIPFGEQLQQYQLLVAPRQGPYAPPPEWADRIHPLELPEELAAVSSSAVREAIAAGEAWERLAPEGAARVIRRDGLYQ
jgi:nicotinate (nicotinamide) nucleotide adenylyltransferase